MTNATSPQTPSQIRAQMCNKQIAVILTTLSSDWDINLPLPGIETPNSKYTELNDLQKKCSQAVRLLIYKDRIEPVYLKFEEKALALYNGWIAKPNADRGLPIPTVFRRRPVTAYERDMLMECFLRVADEPLKQIVEGEKTRGSQSTRARRMIAVSDVDDSPIQIKLPPPKRAGEKSQSSNSVFKRPKLPVTSFTTSLEQERGRPTSKNTSFASFRNLSAAESFASTRRPSIFDTDAGNDNSQDQNSLTQETVPDDNFPNSSNYGSTPTGSFEQPVDAATFSFDGTTSFTSVKEHLDKIAILESTVEFRLQESLCRVFRRSSISLKMSELY